MDANTTNQSTREGEPSAGRGGSVAAQAGEARFFHETPDDVLVTLASAAHDLLYKFGFDELSYRVADLTNTLAVELARQSPDPQQDHARLPRGARSVADAAVELREALEVRLRKARVQYEEACHEGELATASDMFSLKNALAVVLKHLDCTEDQQQPQQND